MEKMGTYGVLLELVTQRGTHGCQLGKEVAVLGSKVFSFCPLACELALKSLEGVHVRVLILVGVIVVGRAVGRERAGAWLAVRRGAGAVVSDGGRKRARRGRGGHGGQTKCSSTYDDFQTRYRRSLSIARDVSRPRIANAQSELMAVCTINTHPRSSRTPL